MDDKPRDETAFSVDPTTGAPVASGAKLAAANEAMQQLAKGLGEETDHIKQLAGDGIDEAAYDEAVASEEPPASEPKTSVSGDEDRPAAPDSEPADPTSEA